MKFNCDCCGLCCRNVGKTFMQAELDRGDGVCKHLTEKNLCKIYYNRPIICNVNAFYEKYLSGQMSRAQFHEMNYKICAELKKTVDG